MVSYNGWVEGYDWRDDANLEQAFEAWRIYLPKDIAHRGLDALRARLDPRWEEKVRADAGETPSPMPG